MSCQIGERSCRETIGAPPKAVHNLRPPRNGEQVHLGSKCHDVPRCTADSHSPSAVPSVLAMHLREASGRQPPAAPQQPPRGEQERPPAKHIRELRRQQRLKEERAEEVGLPIPPPVTGKGGKGKLMFPQSDSYRFVLHIRQLTQDRYL